MPGDHGFTLGVIEGYFGRQWSWRCRHDYASFLRSHGMATYVYAPKNDAYLRKAWQERYPEEAFTPLRTLREHYGATGVDFGIGFSPFELYLDFSPANRALLAAKLDQLATLQPDWFCILFDDMLGSLDALASLQLEIIDFITQRIPARRFAVCPTYYSFDPLLVRHFGTAPERYLESLGEGLDADIDVFWTGQKVISATYPPDHLIEVGAKLRRKPLLWDNYPVNDARRLTPFLHLAPFSGRDPATLRAHCAGQLCNPMNQGYLSQLPLHALAVHYRSGSAGTFDEATRALCPPALANLLHRDAARFQDEGLESLDEASRQGLRADYARLARHPMAAEIVAWLDGEYRFDPACLT